jgi:hypothetical protein
MASRSRALAREVEGAREAEGAADDFDELTPEIAEMFGIGPEQITRHGAATLRT